MVTARLAARKEAQAKRGGAGIRREGVAGGAAGAFPFYGGRKRKMEWTALAAVIDNNSAAFIKEPFLSLLIVLGLLLLLRRTT